MDQKKISYIAPIAVITYADETQQLIFMGQTLETTDVYETANRIQNLLLVQREQFREDHKCGECDGSGIVRDARGHLHHCQFCGSTGFIA